MKREEFKNYKKDEFNKTLQERCKKEGINLRIVFGAACMQFGVDPSCNTIYLLNNEAYTLQNDGNSIRWDFLGMVSGK